MPRSQPEAVAVLLDPATGLDIRAREVLQVVRFKIHQILSRDAHHQRAVNIHPHVMTRLANLRYPAVDEAEAAIPWLEEIVAIPDLPPEILHTVEAALDEARSGGGG